MFCRKEHAFKLGRRQIHALFKQVAVHLGKQVEIARICRIEVCYRPFSEEEADHRTGTVDSNRIPFLTESLLQAVLEHVSESFQLFLALWCELLQRSKTCGHGKRVP